MGIWMPTGPARRSNLTVTAPTAVLLFHIEKTGGSAVMKWLMKNTLAQPPRLSYLFDFVQTACWLSLYPDIFPGYSTLWLPPRCSAPERPRWQELAVAVEFHAHTKARFWKDVAPKLPALRAAYEAVGGRVVAVVALREPASHIVSAYRMWPPQIREHGEKHALPMPEWLHLTAGLQGGSLTGAAQRTLKLGWHNPRGCEAAAQREAGEKLRVFDFVGVMECLPKLLRQMAARLQWPDDEPRLRLALSQAYRDRPFGVKRGGVLWKEAHAWSAEGLNATAAKVLADAAACDAPLYREAAALARSSEGGCT